MSRSRNVPTPLKALLSCGLAGLFACGAIAPATDGGLDDASTASDGANVTPDAAADAPSADATIDRGFPSAKARAIVRMNGGAAADCATVPSMTVGDFGDATTGSPPVPVEDGATQGGKAVAITCRVAPNATGGFDIAGSVAIAGDASLTLRASLDATGKGAGGNFALKKTTAWSSTSCTLDTTVRPGAGAAAGRVWAQLTCGGSKSDTGGTCDIFGEVRFENCTQQ